MRLWRLKEALRRTLRGRPDLLDGRALSKEEAKLLGEVRAEESADQESADGAGGTARD